MALYLRLDGAQVDQVDIAGQRGLQRSIGGQGDLSRVQAGRHGDERVVEVHVQHVTQQRREAVGSAGLSLWLMNTHTHTHTHTHTPTQTHTKTHTQRQSDRHRHRHIPYEEYTYRVEKNTL